MRIIHWRLAGLVTCRGNEETAPREEPQHFYLFRTPYVWCAELTEALFELDPGEWRSEGSQESYDAWFGLMMACKAAGIAREDWLEWCALDECYADDGGRGWTQVGWRPARHADALFKALRDSWAE